MLDQAFGWLGDLVQWVAQFFPRWKIVDTTEGLVKFVKGKDAVAVGPGIHWYWPVTTTIYPYPTSFQSDRLPTQTIVTTDDKTVIIGSSIQYEVTDLIPLVARTHSAQHTVVNLAMSAVHAVVCKMSWEELKLEQRKGTLDTKLKNAAQRELKDYGVKVIALVLIDMAPARVLKLMQSTSQEEN